MRNGRAKAVSRYLVSRYLRDMPNRRVSHHLALNPPQPRRHSPARLASTLSPTVTRYATVRSSSHSVGETNGLPSHAPSSRRPAPPRSGSRPAWAWAGRARSEGRWLRGRGKGGVCRWVLVEATLSAGSVRVWAPRGWYAEEDEIFEEFADGWLIWQAGGGRAVEPGRWRGRRPSGQQQTSPDRPRWKTLKTTETG